MTFSKAGRKLSDLHVNYESVEPYSVVIKEGDLRLVHIPDPKEYYRVEKMKFANKQNKKTVVYKKILPCRISQQVHMTMLSMGSQH